MAKSLFISFGLCSVLGALVACGPSSAPGTPQVLVADTAGPAVIDGQPLEILPLANDTAHQSCSLRLDSAQLGDLGFGTVSVDADSGKIVFVPAPTAAGQPCEISYQASSISAQEGSDPVVVETGTQKIAVTITGPVGDVPIAKPDSYDNQGQPEVSKFTVPVNAAVSLPVTLNDEKIGANSTITNVTTPSNGGSIQGTNQPPGNIVFVGSTPGDSIFSYTISNQSGSSTAQVKVKVMPSASAFITNNSNSELIIRASIDESQTVQPMSSTGRARFFFSLTGGPNTVGGATTFRATTKNPAIGNGNDIVSEPVAVFPGQIITITFDELPTPRLSISFGP